MARTSNNSKVLILSVYFCAYWISILSISGHQAWASISPGNHILSDIFSQLEILNLSVGICKTPYLIETDCRCLSVGITLLLLLYFVTNFLKRGYEGFVGGFLGVVHDGNLLVAY